MTWRRDFPQLAESDLRGLPEAFARYVRLLDRALHEGERDRRDERAGDLAPPVFLGTRATGNQALTAGQITTVQLAAAIDTAGWFDATTYLYTPRQAGFYRCAWAACISDNGGAIAAATYAYARLDAVNQYFTFGYGNGTAQDVPLTGATLVECDGAETTLALKAFISAAGNAVVRGDASPLRTWLAIDYVGSRRV